LYALEQGLALIVIGSRGHGLTKAFLGSAATEMSARPGVPILIAS
jgi:nucleotide-binding universal stress UspA family protein